MQAAKETDPDISFILCPQEVCAQELGSIHTEAPRRGHGKLQKNSMNCHELQVSKT